MKQEWELKRNCSMSPRQVALAYGVLCGVVFLISTGFALHGIWFVFGFGLLEVSAVGVALLYYARHATDSEHIALSEECLVIERSEGGKTCKTVLDPCWTRVAIPQRPRTLIALESRGVKIEIGAFVSEEIRQQVAKELRVQLRGSSYLA